MAEAQYASLDATAVYGLENDYQPNPNAIARRSVSIFSRRGTETPEPKPPFIAQEAMHIPRQMTERQKSWIRRKSIGGGSSPKSIATPKGTILNAVPPAKTIKMTALEEEMATSPNEEILSAVSEHSSSPVAWTAATHRTSPTQQASFWNRSSMSLVQRTKSEKRRDSHSRIGVWVDGIAHWDEGVRPGHEINEEQIVEEVTGFTPVRSIAVDNDVSHRIRPSLSVLIPGGDRRATTMALSTITQPKPRRAVVSVAPASIVSRFNMNPTLTVSEPTDVSPIDLERSRQSMPPPDRPHAPSHLEAVESPDSHPRHASRASSNSSFAEERDDASDYSKRSNRSSATSVEAAALAELRGEKAADGHKPTFSTATPSAAGGSEEVLDLNKALPPYPVRAPKRPAPAPPTPVEPASSRQSRSLRSTKSASDDRQSLRPVLAMPRCRSLTALDACDQEFMRTSPYASDVSQSDSPTLSQAQDDLEAHLSSITEDNAAKSTEKDGQTAEVAVSRSASVKRADSVRSVMHPPERAPTVPKRSRKREWRKSPNHIAQMATSKLPSRRQSETGLRELSMSGEEALAIPSPVRRCRSINTVDTTKVFDTPQLLRERDPRRDTAVSSLPPPPTIVIDDGLVVVRGPVVLGENGEEEIESPVATGSAETVLLRILESLRSTEDLFNTAIINKGMYRVYKENEMDLIRTVLFNQSPAAWEFREWSPPDRNETTSSKASSQLEHTPKTYTVCHKRDLAVVTSLKALMLEHCQTFIRRETAFAFSTPSHPNAQRFNDAFWRIWCFCNIFGNGKGREEDITGQVDWLKGGLLASNQGCVATVNTNLDFDMSSVLLNAPEFFAKGNAGGLSAQQLYDMTEIWTCLSALLQGFQGRVHQARQYGVFESCEVPEGDMEQEEQMLEEWTYHLLTLGPTVVLELAPYASDSSSAGFALAKENGWTNWSPPLVNASRSTFLKEPVARLYEERIATAALKLQNPREIEKKEMGRKRVANLAAEIRLKRQSSSYKRSPYIDMHSERAMSVVSRRASTASYRSQRGMSSIPTVRGVPINPATAMMPSTPNFSSPRPTTPGSPGMWSPRRISPIIEDRVETFNRMSLVNFAAGIAEDTSERAVSKIVEMGFSVEQAKSALRATDLGDGLRVDRAVELLLRARR